LARAGWKSITDIDVMHLLTEYGTITNQDSKKAALEYFDLDKAGELILNKTSKLSAQVLGHAFKHKMKLKKLEIVTYGDEFALKVKNKDHSETVPDGPLLP